jgi:enterochelin esterase-like enzyme
MKPSPRLRRWYILSLGAAFAAVVISAGVATVSAAPTDDVYKLGPDSQPQTGVPQGKVTDWEKLPSTAYPGTLHDFCVYVPAQYDPAKPASLMIFQDGQAWLNPEGEYRAGHVLDNLIHRREIPVIIAVFINPGRTPEQPVATLRAWGDGTSNRGQEYNALDDKYAHVIVDELMPVLNQRYKISANPDDRALAGASSGAIAAFTVAWHRPDQFRKVISTIGSFTNIRGGHVYPDLIRSSEKKPIRIFLQDGLNDNRGVGGGRRDNAAANASANAAASGTPPATPTPPPVPTYRAERDWHTQNVKMVAALTEKGYDVNYTWGIGTHSNKQGGAILPEMLRWLWRDYPRPVDDPLDASNRTLLVPPGWQPPGAAPATSPPMPTPPAAATPAR